MNEREAFLAAWKDFAVSEEPPDAGFLQGYDSSDDSELEDHHSDVKSQLVDRLSTCKDRLGQAVRVIKSEGFILKWLTEELNVSDTNGSHSDLDKVLRIFFPATEKSSSSLEGGYSLRSVATQTQLDATQTGKTAGFHRFRDVTIIENGRLFDACDFHDTNENGKEEIEFEVEFANDNEPQLAGSEREICPGFENTPGTSGIYSGKLFSRENNEFDEAESVFHDDIIVAEGNKLSANDEAEKGNEGYVTRTNVERIPTDRGEEMDEESNNLDSIDQEKPAGHKNRVFTTVFAPLAKGINKAKSKGKWHLPRSSSGSKHRHQRSDSHGSSTSEDDVNNFSSHAESKTLGNLDREQVCCAEVDLNNVCLTNQESMAGVESMRPNCQANRDKVSVRIEGIVENNCQEGNESRQAEVNRCEDAVKDKTESSESPEVIIEEVVDDLISYLERIEFESSDEGDSPPEEEEGIPFGGVIRPRGPLRPRRQLESVLSLGNVSILSADSCVSPWAIDVAASEMQSADSSEQEDNGSCDLNEATRPTSTDSSPGLPGTDQVNKPAAQATPPPVRPPRRSKTERRSQTLESPTRLRAIGVGDDEVFGKEEKAYEGDYDTLTRSSEVTRLPRRSGSEPVRPRSQSADTEEQRKLRKARGSHVVVDESNVDFLSSPVASPQGSPAKHDSGDGDTAQKYHRRKWVVAAVLDSEKGYLECLNILYKHMKPLKLSIESSAPIMSLPDYNKIFCKLDELHAIHTVFYNDLEARVSHWTDRHLIGDLFLSLVDQFDIYRDYILNYKTALETIRKCKAGNEQLNNIFSKELRVNAIQEVTTLEGLFSKPVDRVGRYIVVLNDLIKQTPADHVDFELLTNVLSSTQEFLARISGDQRDGPSITRVKKDHRLVKDGFIVELADGVRKFRHLFLFNDYIICTKRKLSPRSEQYVSKWYISLHELQFHPSESSEAPQVVPVTSRADFDLLKSRIANTKAEIRREEGSGFHSPDSSPATKRRRAQSTNKALEKLKKRQAEQEVALLLAIPSLPLTLYHKQGKTYTLLCKSDVEKSDWKEAIIPLLEQNQGNPSDCGQLSMVELHHLLEACKKLRTCKSLGKVPMKEDSGLLNGLLYLQIHSGRGFHKNDLYCVVEIDHHGQFVRKAKTRTCKAASDPVWAQDFDIEVEGTREMKIHVYCKSRLNRDEHCAQGKIELLKENLVDLKKQTITITLDKQGAITLSLQYSKTPHGIQRKKSVSEKGVFGVDIATVSRREESDIPLVVIGCVQEIEKRGIEEVGIYRVSGASSDVRKLKDAFNNNSQSALVQVAEADIHAVAGLLKMYLRDLPEPLFTDDLYPNFVAANGIKDPEEKKKKMMELFESLPTPNRLTSIYIMDHLRRLSEHSDQNKMGQNNLATVFGPNVLRPSASSGADPQDLAQGTLDVMSQVSIFLWFVKFSSVQLPADPELRHRLDPNKGSPDYSKNPDRLI